MTRIAWGLRLLGKWTAAAALVLPSAVWPQAPAPAQSAGDTTVPVVMLSDLHFDPYRDPAKFTKLHSAPITEWAEILSTPTSATQAEDFAALQKTCNSHALDSSWSLMDASLHAAQARQPKPLFVTVSGDLLVHQFDCRLRTLLPGATSKDVSGFAEKTVAFVTLELRQTFPSIPVYLALGNNDSGCTDYVETLGSDFLRKTAKIFAEDIPSLKGRDSLPPSFSEDGGYSVALPAPMKGARLIVLQDIFESRSYKGCDGYPDTAAPATQIAWLRGQLEEARKAHEHVWVIAHIPPGVDIYASFHKYLLMPAAMCDVAKPTEFLSSEALPNTLTAYADVVRLAVFAHSHMDEIKLLHGPSGGGLVPAKFIPSISPVNGNKPSFLIAQVEPRTEVLKDYSVYVAQVPDGSNWKETYRFSREYGLPDFSAISIQRLTAGFVADKLGDSEWSQSYQNHYCPGDSGLVALGLHQLWTAYACGMAENGGGGPRLHVYGATCIQIANHPPLP